jgi:CDP-diacylglycerol--glycerol-3-phosphate 3-phosphatidyltransferase
MATTSPRRPPVFNLPNQLTTARLGLAIVLFVLIANPGIPGSWLWCLLVFVLAAVTDFLDGYFARKLNLGSTLGRNLDPLVDKVLTCGAYIFLLAVPASGLSPWIVTVVVARELIITGLRGFMEQRGAEFGADWLGKIKMGLQCAALIAIFVYLYADANKESVAANVYLFLAQVRDVLIYAMLLATALSGLQYLWRAAMVLRAEE